MQYIYSCNFTTAEPPPNLEIAASADEENHNEEVDQGGLLPEEGEGTVESPFFSDQAGDKSGEISPPVVDDPVPSSSTQQSCKCQCSEMKEQLEDLQKKVEFLLKEIKKPSSPKSVPARRPPGSTQKGKHAKKNSLTLNICGNYSFTFTLLT